MKVTVKEFEKQFYPAVVMQGEHWILRWTGWKEVANSDYLIAQWIAYPVTVESRMDLERPKIVSSYPGIVSVHVTGDTFYTAPQYGKQIVPDRMTSVASLAMAKRSAFMDLLDFVKKYVDPITDFRRMSYQDWKRIGVEEPPF